jgi:hypothetical protein
VTGNRENRVASWGKPLPYPIIIADRRNNRLIEVALDKRIIWEFPSPNLKVYRGNEDVSFSPDGKQLAISEEDNYDVHIVDYEKRALTWTWGTPDTKGRGDILFNFPDDAHILDDGIFLTNDIRNCRVMFIDPKENKVHAEWGTRGKCRHDPPRAFGYPNGATDFENGDILVTEIQGAWLSRITRAGKVLWSVQAPNIHYASDSFPTVDGKQNRGRRLLEARPRRHLRSAHAQDQLGVHREEGWQGARPPVDRDGAARDRRHPGGGRPERPCGRDRSQDQGNHLAVRGTQEEGPRARAAQLPGWRGHRRVPRLEGGAGEVGASDSSGRSRMHKFSRRAFTSAADARRAGE